MNRKNIFSLLLISLLAIFIIGCNTNDSLDSDKENDAEETSENTESNFPLEVTDNTGNKITIEEEPTEIISVMPSNTEILFELGLGDKVIAVTENDAYPEEVLDLDTVGDFEINVEKIISLDPDLVLAHESSVASSFDAYEQIQDAGINVYFVLDATSIEETYDSITEIGQITGAEQAAEEVIADMKAGFAEIEAIVNNIDEDEKKTVLFEISPEPEIFTGGKGTFFNELIEVIGAENVAGDLDGWPQIDPESIIDLNPDVILTVYGEYVEDATEQVLNRDGFSEVTAVKEKAVYDVDEDMVSRPGPRLVDGAREMGQAVYPEHFKN
ncbi:MAG TPA: ABC transporter substrate-binding protein [Pseudogracilibacillus sp.]|nr:ABC transporter substrate-binding protein [Pseudogracilibacillus sp.]